MALLLLAALALAADPYWVAPLGSDATGDGSELAPWATLDHALDEVPRAGGVEIVLRDGTYRGQAVLTHGFDDWVTVRAEHPYRAVLTNVDGGGEALRVYHEGPVRLELSGLVFTNAHASYDCPDGREPYYLVHLQDVADVVLSDCVLFGNNAPGTCNEVLKINRGSETAFPMVRVEGCLLYDPANAGGADLIDSVRPGAVEIVDSVFFGEPTHDRSQSFITLKRQAPGSLAPRFLVHRNVFLHWGGKSDQAFVQLGEDGVAEPEITDAIIENNLFIGDSPARQAAPIQIKGGQQVLIRHNTVVGDLPSGAFALRTGTEGDNPPVRNLALRGNLFADPTGTMGTRLVNAYGDVEPIALEGNLYWNAGAALPSEGLVTPADDAAGVVADPLLPVAPEVVLPRWQPDGTFADGSTSIAQVHARLVDQWAALGEASPAVDAGASLDGPLVDIRGYPRDGEPDLGAFELDAAPEDTGEVDSGDGRDEPRCGCASGGGAGWGWLALLGALAQGRRRRDQAESARRRSSPSRDRASPAARPGVR